MVPSLWLRLDDFPRGEHGKLDRRVLRSQLERHFSAKATFFVNGQEHREAKTETEITLVAILAQLLDRSQSSIDLDRSFLSQGGNSLQAMRFASALQAHGFAASVSDCLDDRKTVSMLAALPRVKPRVASTAPNGLSHGIDSYQPFVLAPDNWRDAVTLAGIPIQDVEDVYPCTTLVRHWLNLALISDGRAILIQDVHNLGSDIDSAHFSWCWEQLRLREPALRTVFVAVEKVRLIINVFQGTKD